MIYMICNSIYDDMIWSIFFFKENDESNPNDSFEGNFMPIFSKWTPQIIGTQMNIIKNKC